MKPAPILVIGYGNPDRGDDGAGIEVVNRLARSIEGTALEPNVETRTAVQLMIEHAAWLNGRVCAVFVDCAENVDSPCRVSEVEAVRDRSYTSHQLSPPALLEVQQRAFAQQPGRSWLVEIPGREFALAAGFSPTTRQCLPSCLDALTRLVTRTVSAFA